ncbi:hypothetical protein RhiirA5_421223 [Rhizophagus irregularis]|uniref:Uncharacterized protein n=1 Tax=Rhizophagus irregularis TaxID=588596 RepID=A0A2N0PED0_9GLOM|nr:hypothetical protein RhiirA5_421223 [Rhizophagus irregularis]
MYLLWKTTYLVNVVYGNIEKVRKYYDTILTKIHIPEKLVNEQELWRKECDPLRIMEGWTSGNSDIDKFIKDTMYNIRIRKTYINKLLEQVTFDRFIDINEIW